MAIERCEAQLGLADTPASPGTLRQAQRQYLACTWIQESSALDCEQAVTDSNSHDNTSRFACVGCGACCRGRFVPLTLAETLAWLRRGHSVAVLLEGFDESAWPSGAPEFDYNLLRSAPVACGAGSLQVTAIFAANVIPQCPNLGADDLCAIYTERPLVCRIYPMEINPFIALAPSSKDCPPESWEQGNLLGSDRELTHQILQSRQADRDDAQRKVQLCEALGLTTAAWKGNGFTVYMPTVERMLAALEGLASEGQTTQPWRIRADDVALHEALEDRSFALQTTASADYIFHQL
ncbi:YkgJ family cysteine cluster protein [Pseudomonas reidholzensis]|uniref:YkgJ family cysteine cluster protein n=1 Tax=Pseudomonas reidholzensis TaxID=1785162 RepID=UPI001FC9EB07|nr:YkgJ family cysteine cluster protein [Pseudomonas reidholzensis]